MAVDVDRGIRALLADGPLGCKCGMGNNPERTTHFPECPARLIPLVTAFVLKELDEQRKANAIWETGRAPWKELVRQTKELHQQHKGARRRNATIRRLRQQLSQVTADRVALGQIVKLQADLMELFNEEHYEMFGLAWAHGWRSKEGRAARADYLRKCIASLSPKEPVK